MRQPISIDEAVGRTIEAVVWDYSDGERLLITLSPGNAYVLLKARQDYESEPEICSAQLDPMRFDRAKLIGADVMTPDEVSAHEAKRAKEEEEKRERWERLQYEALKAKFEGKA